MPDTKKYLDIDGLTEYHETTGHSADIADGSITTAKLANGAVSNDKLSVGAVSWEKLRDSAVDTTKLQNLAVTTDKLDTNAVTTTKLADGAVQYGNIDGGAIRAIREFSLVAADSQTDQALTALGYPHSMFTPKQMAVSNAYTDSTCRLCWIKGSYLEVAAISFFGDLQSGQITLYAKGINSTASGKLGVDTSWTID